jgi:hypothetical protein
MADRLRRLLPTHGARANAAEALEEMVVASGGATSSLGRTRSPHPQRLA